MPEHADRILRRLVVTPDIHRVHHSVIILETDSNYGFNFPWWDRLLGTYRAQPAAGHAAMTLGLGPDSLPPNYWGEEQERKWTGTQPCNSCRP